MKGGPTRGPIDLLLRALFAVVAPFYAVGGALRRLAYRAEWLERRRAPGGIRVVSVGNLTLGGSGKTPLVIALARRYAAEGRRVAVILRGYGSRAARGPGPAVVRDADAIRADVSDVGDEAMELAAALPGCVVIVSPRRAEGVELAVSNLHRCDVALLDDAFQHLAIRRHVDLVVLDLALPPAAWRLFPRGYLREPVSALARANAWVIFDDAGGASDDRGGSVESDDSIEERLAARLASTPRKPILRARRGIAGLLPLSAFAPGEDADDRPAPERTGADGVPWPALAFAGLAHPERLEASLRALGADPAHSRLIPFGDHHVFTRADVEALAREWTAWSAALPDAVCTRARLVCTAKDAVKLAKVWRPGDPALQVLALEVELVDPEAWTAVLSYDPMP